MSDERDVNSGAISIYGADAGTEDFPVLKAFQQYLADEQNKARKRMVYLAIFFCCLMTIVIAVFMLMMHTISTRNQELNDRLVEFAMRERDRAPVVQPQPAVQQPTPNDAAMKAMVETLQTLQRELTAVKAAPPPIVEKPAADDAAERARKDEIEKLKRANALLKEEKMRLAKKEQELAEREAKRIHDEEIERHRRRLYPEYYAQQDAAKAAAAKREAEEQAEAEKRDADAAILEELEKLQDDEDAELINEFKQGTTSDWTFPE